MDNATEMRTEEGKRQHLDLFLLLFLATLAVVCVLLLPDGNALRVIMAVPLMILYPGYAMVSALWPENNAEGKSIDMLGRVAMSIGLSIVIISLTGLVLSFTNELLLLPVLACNLAILIALTVIAIFRRNRLPPTKRFSPISLGQPTALFSGNSDMVLTALIVVGIVICSGFAAYAVFKTADVEPDSRLYVLDSNRTAQDYPVNITANETVSVILGIVNNEQSLTNYTLLVESDNYTAPIYVNDWNNTFQITNTTSLARNITLASDTAFEEPFFFYFSEPGEYRVVWHILVEGEATEYQVQLLIKVNP